MHAKTLCAVLVLGLLLVPGADADDEDPQDDRQRHCPPVLNEDFTPHRDCFCPMDPDPLGICDRE